MFVKDITNCYPKSIFINCPKIPLTSADSLQKPITAIMLKVSIRNTFNLCRMKGGGARDAARRDGREGAQSSSPQTFQLWQRRVHELTCFPSASFIHIISCGRYVRWHWWQTFDSRDSDSDAVVVFFERGGFNVIESTSKTGEFCWKNCPVYEMLDFANINSHTVHYFIIKFLI